MRSCGFQSLEQYADHLEVTTAECDKLLKAITINVTGFFRNPEVWEPLAELLKGLMSREGPSIRVWSAGCASGEEPYSLALLTEWLHRRDEATAAREVRIDATDIDSDSLARAERGCYSLPDSSPIHPAMTLLERQGTRVLVPSAVKSRVRFHQADLLSDPAPTPPYHVILCRNVTIYLERSAQHQVYAGLADSLAPGGLLLLGRVESIAGPIRGNFQVLHSRERIYRKIS